MCDEDSLNLQNIVHSVPRRELKIILEKPNTHFLLWRTVWSVFLCLCAQKKKAVNVYLQKIIFGKIMPLN